MNLIYSISLLFLSGAVGGWCCSWYDYHYGYTAWLEGRKRKNGEWIDIKKFFGG